MAGVHHNHNPLEPNNASQLTATPVGAGLPAKAPAQPTQPPELNHNPL